MNSLKLALALSLLTMSMFGQTADAPTGRSHWTTLTVASVAGAHGASTVFTAPATGFYTVHWSMRTTTAGSAGTITALTLAWNNGNAMSRNSLLMGPQILDLASLTSTGLTSAEITGQQDMYVVSGTAVTWATTVGVALIGSPLYAAEFRVEAKN
jgi:hypothetical protein